MGLNYDRKVMIECLFRNGYGTYDGVKYDDDEFGECYHYLYPGHDDNRFYPDRGIITGRWSNFHDMKITSVKSLGEEETVWWWSIILYNGKYYICKDAHIVLKGGRGPNQSDFISLEIKSEQVSYEDVKERKCKTVKGFERLLSKITLTPLRNYK